MPLKIVFSRPQNWSPLKPYFSSTITAVKEKVSRRLRPQDPPPESLAKVLKKSGKSLEKRRQKTFSRLFPDCRGPATGGPRRLFSDFFGVSGPEGQRDPCKWSMGSQNSHSKWGNSTGKVQSRQHHALENTILRCLGLKCSGLRLPQESKLPQLEATGRTKNYGVDSGLDHLPSSTQTLHAQKVFSKLFFVSGRRGVFSQ